MITERVEEVTTTFNARIKYVLGLMEVHVKKNITDMYCFEAHENYVHLYHLLEQFLSRDDYPFEKIEIVEDRRMNVDKIAALHTKLNKEVIA